MKMPHDHARKAGNKGDVWKHFALVTVADRLVRTDTFRYVDTHAGAPCHELSATGEWDSGIGKVLERCSDLQTHGYIEVASGSVRHGRYPSAWRFVVERACLVSRQVEVYLTDTADAVAAEHNNLPIPGIPENVTVRFDIGDGFARLGSVSNADLVLIDPPFSPNADADWRRLRKACCSLVERDIAFLAWYPIFGELQPMSLVAATGCLAWEVIWAPMGPEPSQDLRGCGVLASQRCSGILLASRSELEKLASCLGGNFSPRSHGVKPVAAADR